MTDLTFIWQSLKSRWLNSSLSILLTALGVSLAVLISQFGSHINTRLSQDGKNIDIVVGAKGSPLQLILSSIYHIDIPTGNIAYESVQKLIKNPQIKSAIPIALGDNWRGFRIVGTTKNYITHYEAKLNQGRTWNEKFEAVAGSSVNLKINKEIVGAHGLFEGGDKHDNNKYKIVGVLKSTGTVIDRLIITSLDSVLQIHGQKNLEYQNILNDENSLDLKNHKLKNKHNDSEHEHHEPEHDDHDSEYEHHDSEHHDHNSEYEHRDSEHEHEKLKSPEITSLLITTKSPLANINLPRTINRESTLQAANPALEIARLLSIFGLGSKTLLILSTLLIGIAALSIFSGLASNLENRIGDLAVLRAIGYSKNRVFKIIILEGLSIVFCGLCLGILMGILGFKTLIYSLTPINIYEVNITINFDLVYIFFIVIFIGFLAALFPAYVGSKISVAKQLSRT